MLRIAMGVAQGLSYIHGKHILHHDVWSANILVTGGCEYLELLAVSDSHTPLAKITGKEAAGVTYVLRLHIHISNFYNAFISYATYRRLWTQ